MSSTPAGFDSGLRRGRSPGRVVIGVLAGLCMPCGLGCEPAPVTLRLTLAEGLGPPSFVRFVFALDDGTVIEDGPIAREALATERFVEIPPRVSFTIDVIGCLRGPCRHQKHRRHDKQTRQDSMPHGYPLGV